MTTILWQLQCYAIWHWFRSRIYSYLWIIPFELCGTRYAKLIQTCLVYCMLVTRVLQCVTTWALHSVSYLTFTNNLIVLSCKPRHYEYHYKIQVQSVMPVNSIQTNYNNHSHVTTNRVCDCNNLDMCNFNVGVRRCYRNLRQSLISVPYIKENYSYWLFEPSTIRVGTLSYGMTYNKIFIHMRQVWYCLIF